MKIMEALESQNLMLMKGNRWLVLNRGTFAVFEHHARKATDTQLYVGLDEDAAVKILVEGKPGSANENES